MIDFSSEFGSGWEAANLTPSRADIDPKSAIVRPMIWSSASMAPFPHWITTLVFDNCLEEPDHPCISAKEIEIWAGAEQDKLAKVAAITLRRNESGNTDPAVNKLERADLGEELGRIAPLPLVDVGVIAIGRREVADRDVILGLACLGGKRD